jgi:hypothetical protein
MFIPINKLRNQLENRISESGIKSLSWICAFKGEYKTFPAYIFIATDTGVIVAESKTGDFNDLFAGKFREFFTYGLKYLFFPYEVITGCDGSKMGFNEHFSLNTYLKLRHEVDDKVFTSSTLKRLDINKNGYLSENAVRDIQEKEMAHLESSSKINFDGIDRLNPEDYYGDHSWWCSSQGSMKDFVNTIREKIGAPLIQDWSVTQKLNRIGESAREGRDRIDALVEDIETTNDSITARLSEEYELKKDPNPSNQYIPGQIKKLATLKDEGILTEEEFNTKKAELLAKM